MNIINILFLIIINSLYVFANIDLSDVKTKIIDRDIDHCLIIDKRKKICVRRILIESESPALKQYQKIYINGELIATGYPKLTNKTSKVLKWQKINNIDVDSNNIYFNIDDVFYKYNFLKKQFFKINLPKNILKILAVDDKDLFIQYIQNNKISLSLLNTNDFTIKNIHSKYHVILRKKNIIDFIKTDQQIFIKKYQSFIGKNDKFIELISSNYIPLKYSIESVKDNNVFTIDLKYDDYISQDKQGLLVVKSLLLNKKFKVLSKKIFVYNSIDEYFKNKFLSFEELPQFVHGNKSIWILFFTVLIIVFSFVFLKKLIGGFQLPTITSFFLLFYLLISVIGSTFLNLFYFKYEYFLGMYERLDLLFNIWLYSIVGLILILSGVFISNKIFHYNNKEYKLFLVKPIKFFQEKEMFYFTFSMMVIACIVLSIYIYKIGFIPIFGIFEHLMPDQLAHLRSTSGNDFNGKLYRYILFYKTIPLLMLIISFIYKKTNKRWMLLFIFILFYNIFVSIMDMQKAPLVWVFIVLVITYMFIIGEIKWKIILWTFLLVLLSLWIMYIFFMGISSDGLFSTLLAPFHRFFIGSISPFFWWQLYVEKYGYLGGLSLPNPHHIFNFNYIQISKEVMNFVHPELKDIGIVGSMPVVFWGDFYINFGKITMFISMFLFGFLLRSIDILFTRYLIQNKTVLILSMYIFFIYSFKQYNATSVFGIIFDTDIIIPSIIIFSLQYFLSKKERFEKSNFNSIK